MPRYAEFTPPAPDVVLSYQGVIWNAEAKTKPAHRWLKKVRFATQDSRCTDIWLVPTYKVKTFMTLGQNAGLIIITL